MIPTSASTARVFATGTLLLLLVGLSGCPKCPPKAIEPWQPMHVVVSRINENSAKLDFMLQAKGSARGRLAEPGGSPHDFHLDTIVHYRKPRILYMKFNQTFQDGLIELGSNHEEFWFWDQVAKPPIYKWGRHDRMSAEGGESLRLRPDQLLEVIGLHELPIEPVGARGPFFRVLPEYYELTYLEQNEFGRRYVSEAVEVPRREPFLPEVVLFYAADGHPVLIAKLSEYKEIEDGGVRAPTMIRVDWPEDDSWLELAFSSMKRFDNAEALIKRDIAPSPRQRGKDVGVVIRVDQSIHRPIVPATAPATQDTTNAP